MTGFLLFMGLLAFIIVALGGIVGGSILHEEGEQEVGVTAFGVGCVSAVLAIADLIYMIVGNYS